MKLLDAVEGRTSMSELQVISTRRLDVIDITRCTDKPAQKFTVVHGALIGVIIAEFLLIAILV